MDPESVRLIVLDDAFEDFGFYELVWDFNARWPDVDRGAKVALARDAVRGLLDDGLIKVSYSRSWTSHETLAQDSAAAHAAIDDDASWLDPSSRVDGSYYSIAITAAGKLSLAARGGGETLAP